MRGPPTCRRLDGVTARGLGKGAGGSHLTGCGEAPGRWAWMGSWHWCSPTPPSASLRPSHPNSCLYLPVILQDLSRSHQRPKPPDHLKVNNDPPAVSYVSHPPTWGVRSGLGHLCPALSASRCQSGRGSRPRPGTWGAAPARGADTVLQPCAIDEGVPLVGCPRG